MVKGQKEYRESVEQREMRGARGTNEQASEIEGVEKREGKVRRRRAEQTGDHVITRAGVADDISHAQNSTGRGISHTYGSVRADIRTPLRVLRHR